MNGLLTYLLSTAIVDLSRGQSEYKWREENLKKSRELKEAIRKDEEAFLKRPLERDYSWQEVIDLIKSFDNDRVPRPKL